MEVSGGARPAGLLTLGAFQDREQCMTGRRLALCWWLPGRRSGRLPRSATLSSAAYHHRSALCGRWRIRHDGPHHRSADGRTARPVSDRGDITARRGLIGVQHVINAKPDGYTVLLGSVGTHAYNQSIYRKRRYDAVSDFTPVTLFSDSQMVLEGRKDLPANNIEEFIALKKNDRSKHSLSPCGEGKNERGAPLTPSTRRPAGARRR